MEKVVYEDMNNEENIHWWFLARKNIISSVLGKILPKRNNLILDIGCGTGGNLGMLSTFGNVTGLEMDEDAAMAVKTVGKAVEFIRKTMQEQDVL